PDHRRDNTEWLAECLRQPGTRIYPRWQNRSLFTELDGTKPKAVTFSPEEMERLGQLGGEPIFLGLNRGKACFALDLTGFADPEKEPTLANRGSFADLRMVGMLLPHEEAAILAHARALAIWHRSEERRVGKGLRAR